MAHTRILLIDDSSLVRNLLTRSLSAQAEEQGLRVLGTATNGRDGLEKLLQLKPDVVITDMDMPVMNGLEFIRQAMAMLPTPIIVLSSWTQNDKNITLQALEAGAVDFIPKPSAMSPNGFDGTLQRLIVKIKAAARASGLAAATKRAQSPNEASPNETPLFHVSAEQRRLAANAQTKTDERRQREARTYEATLSEAKSSEVYEIPSGQTVVGVGEIAASNRRGAIIKTFALGSCVALTLFSPTFDIAAMAHIALPSSATDAEKAKVLPGYFADTALPTLINEMRAAGYKKPVSQLIAKIAGGAQTSADQNNFFKIGEKNVAAVANLLKTFGIALVASDTGSAHSRTVFLQVGSNLLHLSSPDKPSWTI
jgi:chemotaxis protein CheD